MTIRVEKKGSVFTVIIDRPEVKNAVDGPTAEELASAFHEFDNDKDYSIAVLCGAGSTFCAGADLKANAGMDKTCKNRIDPEFKIPSGSRKTGRKTDRISANLPAQRSHECIRTVGDAF